MTTTNTESSETNEPIDNGKPRARWLWILLSLFILFCVVYVLSYTEDTIDIEEVTTTPSLQLVSVIPVPTGPQTVEVSSFAEVLPRWSAELRSAVSGRVTKVHDSALVGELVKANTTLIEIEKSRYLAELASAEQALKEANLALWTAKNANIIARKEYKRNGTKAPNELALKLPQLNIAKSAEKSAEARLLAARRQLNDTKITAPFSGFVTERFVSPGQTVNIGDPLVKLVDDTSFELEVELGQKDWRLLKKPLDGQISRILDQEGKLIAMADIRRGGGFLDESTRQYKVFLAMDQPSDGKILSGDFVRVLLPGITVPAALEIPASALTQEGYVWYLDKDDRLQRIEPDVLFHRQGRVVVRAPDGIDSLRVAVTPLVSFLPGQQVRAQDAGK